MLLLPQVLPSLVSNETSQPLADKSMSGWLGRFRPDDRWACLVAYALLACWCFPLLFAPSFRGPPNVDWEWFLAYFQALRTTLVDYHQFPGFNPWMYLGTPLWANPQIGPLSHFLPLVILFGPVYGMKLGIAACYFLSFEAGRALGRALFSTPQAAVLAGLLYALNTGMAAHWVLGHVCFSAYALAPWLILFCLRLPTHRWAGASAGAIAGLMVHYGIHYYMLYILFLGGLLLLYLALSRKGRLVRFGGQFMLVFLLVAAPRLWPLLDVLHDFPRKLWLPFALNAQALWQMFFVPELGPPHVVLRIQGEGSVFQLTSSEMYAYPGMLVLAAALISLRWGVRFFHVGALLSFCLMMGTYQPWHPSRWLSYLRPFDSMWVVTRWRLVLLACLALAAAAAFDGLLRWAKKGTSLTRERIVTLFGWLLPLELLLLLLPSWMTHLTPYRDHPISRAKLGLPDTSFMLSVEQLRFARSQIPIYFSLFRANVGSVKGYDPLFGYVSAPSRRRYWGHPHYKGEFTLADDPILPLSWSPNRLRFEKLAPGKELEINLNPGRGWFVNGQAIFTDFRSFEPQRRFVITVPPSGIVDLNYLPPGLYKGIGLSLICGLILFAWWCFERRRERRREPRPAPP